MASELRLPNLHGNEREQLVQLKSYLFQLIPQLQYELNQLSNKTTATNNTETNLHTSAATDTVVDVGVHTDGDNRWRYRKWKSGVVDFDGLVKVNPEVGGVKGMGVYYSKDLVVSLPFYADDLRFVVAPAAYDFFAGNTAPVTGNPNKIRFTLYRYEDFIDMSVPLDIRIIGRGKIK